MEVAADSREVGKSDLEKKYQKKRGIEHFFGSHGHGVDTYALHCGQNIVYALQGGCYLAKYLNVRSNFVQSKNQRVKHNNIFLNERGPFGHSQCDPLDLFDWLRALCVGGKSQRLMLLLFKRLAARESSWHQRGLLQPPRCLHRALHSLTSDVFHQMKSSLHRRPPQSSNPCSYLP